MNDTELDKILDSWTVPSAPASLRERMRAGFTIPAARAGWRTVFVRRARKGFLSVAVVALGVLVLVVIQAVAQTLRPVRPPAQVPYVVESEFVQYASDGSPKVAMHTTSYSQDRGEVIFSRTFPGNPFGTAVAGTLDVLMRQAQAHLWRGPSPQLTPEMEERLRAARANPNRIGLIFGCGQPMCWVTEHYGFQGIGGEATGCAQDGIVGHETILNYPTVAAQRALGNSNRRMTLWMAPDLGCFALRVRLEERGPDGAFHLVSGKQALKVTWNP